MESRDNNAAEVLLRAFPEELDPRSDGRAVHLSHENASWTFVPIWVGEGLPADAKRARNEFSHVISRETSEIPVVTARRISPGAREILETSGLSWADASGRARVIVPGRLYVTRLDPIRADARRPFKWSAAADAIAETLLTAQIKRSGFDRVTEIAETADVSLAHAARVLRQFDALRYTAKIGAERGSSAGREFRDAGRMLSDWAGHYSHGSGLGRAAEFHVPWRETEQSMFTLIDAFAGWDWAVTSEVAADRIAPYLTTVSTLDLYVPAGQFEAARTRLSQQLDVTEVESGGRIRVYAAAPYVFRLTDEVRGVRTVSPVRVYADLLRHQGRSAEAAEHLREVAIGF